MIMSKKKKPTLRKLSLEIDSLQMTILAKDDGGFRLISDKGTVTDELTRNIKSLSIDIKNMLGIDLDKYFSEVGMRLASGMPVDFIMTDIIKDLFSKRQLQIDQSWDDAVKERSLSKIMKFKKCVDDWETWWMARFKDGTTKKDVPVREQRPSLAVRYQKVVEAMKDELRIDDETTLESWAIENHPELADDLYQVIDGIKEIIEGGSDMTKFDGLLTEYQEFWRGVHSLYVMENP